MSSLSCISLFIAVPMFLLAICSGSLVPLWMFINSLTLIAHAPLLSESLPSNLSYYLVKILDILRLNVTSLKPNKDDQLNSALIEDSNNSFTSSLL